MSSMHAGCVILRYKLFECGAVGRWPFWTVGLFSGSISHVNNDGEAQKIVPRLLICNILHKYTKKNCSGK